MRLITWYFSIGSFAELWLLWRRLLVWWFRDGAKRAMSSINGEFSALAYHGMRTLSPTPALFAESWTWFRRWKSAKGVFFSFMISSFFMVLDHRFPYWIGHKFDTPRCCWPKQLPTFLYPPPFFCRQEMLFFDPKKKNTDESLSSSANVFQVHPLESDHAIAIRFVLHREINYFHWINISSTLG